MRKILIAVMAMVTIFWFTTPTHATLWDRGGGLIYDDDFNITWLQDAGLGGQRSWSSANTWAASLTYYDSVRNVTYDDWRLPTSLNQDGSGLCLGWNCTGSEMGHLFYTELGNSASNAPPFSLNNTAPFTNLHWGAYWSSTKSSDPSLAWSFQFHSGWQDGVYAQWNTLSFLAVRDGDVVPEPATLLLLGSGLIGLAGYGRKKFFKK